MSKPAAESLGYLAAKVGILTRIERVLVLAPCLGFSDIPMVALWILAILGNFTALHKDPFLSGSKLLVH